MSETDYEEYFPPLTGTLLIPFTEEERHHMLSAMLGGTVTTACPICSRVIEKLRRVAVEGGGES